MELTDIIRILNKRWWIVVVAVVLTAGSAVAFSELQPPEYTSTAEVIIEPARPDLGLTQSAKSLLRTYMTVANSNKWAEDVIRELELSTTPQLLRNDVHFAAELDRFVIKIEVENHDGDQANRIALAWAEHLQNWRNEQNQAQRKEDRVYAYLRDQPSYGQTWPPSTKIMLGAGAVFGLIIGGVIIFFLEWLEAGMIRTPQDIERNINLTVLAAIPSERSRR